MGRVVAENLPLPKSFGAGSKVPFWLGRGVQGQAKILTVGCRGFYALAKLRNLFFFNSMEYKYLYF